MKELVKLAESKGFESYFMTVISFIHCSEHVITDPEFINHLWLCELQKWLREEHYTHLWIELVYHDGNNYVIQFQFKILTFFNNTDEADAWEASFDRVFDTYEEALEKGLFEALKLIK